MEVEIEAGKKILEQCLSSEEYGKLDTSVIKKIEIFFEDKFNDFLTAKALAETEKTNYSEFFFPIFLQFLQRILTCLVSWKQSCNYDFLCYKSQLRTEIIKASLEILENLLRFRQYLGRSLGYIKRFRIVLNANFNSKRSYLWKATS